MNGNVPYIENMPKGPQGQRRPADVIGAAIRVARIATGEEEETTSEPGKAKAGRKGGPARAKKLTPEERSKIASVAAQARWKKS
jgi:hypothetical protein